MSVKDEAPTKGDHALMVPAFGNSPALHLEMGVIREAEHRIIEAKTVNPSTYADLEHSFNAAYRDLKRHLSLIGYQIMLAEKAMEEAKADVLLDKYPAFMEGKPKAQDNADYRKAFLIRDEEYSAALDYFNKLKAFESNFEGKVKVFENTCRYMRKEMDLILRSGLTDRDLYNTQRKK
jgi:hypothetical protein